MLRSELKNLNFLNKSMLKKYVSPQLTKLGSLYGATNAMNGGYSDMMGGNMANP